MQTQTHRNFPFTLALATLVLSLSVRPLQAQSFTLETPMLAARWAHTATLLTNGLVLIAGGEIDNNYGTGQIMKATNSCELYNPATGSSTLTGPMNESHFGHTATLLNNGKVLVVGGRNNNGSIISVAELYDPATGSWTDTGYLHKERCSFAATLLPSGKVLVVAGYSGSGEEASAELYDPATETWSAITPMNYATDSPIAVLLPNGKVLVAGGSDGSGGALTNAVLFNPADETWTNTAPLKTGRAGHAATLLTNGQVLVAGGAYDNTAELYNPSTGAWTYTGTLNDSRGYPSLTLLPNGQVLVIGGYAGQTTTELYDPATAVWTNAATLNVGRIFHTATLVSQGQVVVAGGDVSEYNGPALADVETYNQASQGSRLGIVLDATNLVWASSGDTSWFGETTNTHDSISAAQSGSVTNNQVSTLTATVTGPGVLTFYWSSIANDPNAGFDFEFYLDDPGTGRIADLYGNHDWAQFGPFVIPVGQHTLGWTVGAYGDTDSTQAGFLDQVSYNTVFVPPSPGGWTATGALTNAPYLHSATLLPNGKAIVCGGSDNSGHASAGVQLYDPNTGAWTSTNTMGKARFAHTATLLPGGKVLIAGGITSYDSFSLVQTVELFNPTNGTWTTTGALKRPRYGHTATLLANGKVLVAGGMGTNGSNVNLTNLYSSELYDPTSGVWTVTGVMSAPHDGPTATVLPNGKVLVAGGATPSGGTSAAELYDPASGLWTNMGPMTINRQAHAATLLTNGMVLVAGGETVNGMFIQTVNSAELYNPATGTWTATGSMQGTHDHHTLTLLPNGLVLLAGTSQYYNPTNTAELYDPASGQWTVAARMNFPRTQHTATLLPSGKVLAVGGFIATAELFDSTATSAIVLLNPTKLPDRAFQFAWLNAPGSSNVVLAATNLAMPLSAWTVLGGATETSAGHFQFTDTQAANHAIRFYRVRSP